MKMESPYGFRIGVAQMVFFESEVPFQMDEDRTQGLHTSIFPLRIMTHGFGNLLLSIEAPSNRSQIRIRAPFGA